MPEYVQKDLDGIQHPKLKILQYYPHFWTVRAYGKRLQMAPDLDKSNIISKKGTKII